MKIDIKDWHRVASNRMYGIDPAILALGYTWNAQQNIILHGPPGYGKSMLAEMFGEYLVEKGAIQGGIYIKSLHGATTEDDLLGGINVKTYQTEGELIHLLHMSFANYEFVILEEFGDAYVGALTVLKDILVSKKVRYGSSDRWFEIKTKMVVAATNKQRSEMIRDLTTAAIFERFPADVEVTWASWNFADYAEMLNRTNFKDRSYEIDFVSKAVELAIANRKSTPSPRTAYMAVHNMVENETHEGLRYFAEIGEYIDQVSIQLKVMRKRKILEQMSNMVHALAEDSSKIISDINGVDIDIIIDASRPILKKVFSVMITLKKYDATLGDDAFDLANGVLERSKALVNNLMREIQEKIVDPKEGTMQFAFFAATPPIINNYVMVKVADEPHILDILIEDIEEPAEIEKMVSELKSI